MSGVGTVTLANAAPSLLLTSRVASSRLRNVALAGFYALEELGAGSVVGILDIDAHHGNGIAHLVQAEERIRYVSIHERRGGGGVQRPEYDPRSPDESDKGPKSNLKNIELEKGSDWASGYESALSEALEFLRSSDVLLVAAGFDALREDPTSSLRLTVDDFNKVARAISAMGIPLAVGLEGGYTQKLEGASGSLLSDCVLSFAEGLQK